MPYAIMRFDKKKAGGVASCDRHNERLKESYPSNPSIDMERTKDNYHIIEPPGRYLKTCQDFISKRVARKPKSNAVTLVETFVGCSPTFIKALPVEEQKAFFERAVDFLAVEVGRENIVSAVVHMDETTPHMHVAFVPITKDGRLSARDILGNQKSLSSWQDRFHEWMNNRYPELERGVSARITHRKHFPIWMYKRGEALDARMEDISKALVGINFMNAGKKRDEVVEIIADWAFAAKKLSTQMSSLDDYTKQLEKRVEKQDAEIDYYKGTVSEIKHEKHEADETIINERLRVRRLKEKLDARDALIAKLPPDVVQAVKRKEDREWAR